MEEAVDVLIWYVVFQPSADLVDSSPLDAVNRPYNLCTRHVRTFASHNSEFFCLHILLVSSVGFLHWVCLIDWHKKSLLAMFLLRLKTIQLRCLHLKFLCVPHFWLDL